MAQLFQPTNITPDTRGSFGNGVVTLDTGATIWQDYIYVSWQVNGNTPMTAFQIDFTSMSGTALYSTGKLTDGCPFYGTAPDGNTQLFSYTVGPLDGTIESSFLRQESEGLMRITQWWGSGANDYVEQQSPSHYIVREGLYADFTPSGIVTPLTNRSVTFTGTFSGDEDGLMWMRWVLSQTDGTVLKDTGKLYGNVEPKFTYDMFLPGTYMITLSAETSMGVSYSGTRLVRVEYDIGDPSLEVTACQAPSESAIRVRWNFRDGADTTGVNGFAVYRKKEGADSLEPVGTVNFWSSGENSILDYGARNGQGPYVYYVYPLSASKIISTPSESQPVTPCYWNWTVLSCTTDSNGDYRVQESYLFGKNLQSGSVSNNNQPGVFKNFTPYPTVMIAPQNYRTGTLQSLIGTVEDGAYSDTTNLQDAIYSLSLTTNTLFLKNRKGDLLRIRLSDAITMETMDNTREQAQTVSFPWVEVGSADGERVWKLTTPGGA